MNGNMNKLQEKALNIVSAPTLVVVTKEGTEVIENVSNIRRYIELNLVK